ncbi:hypothetical protein GH714_004358 [Hevea brasiliensis]|uniref:Uncharacterized protein n=1 Tax=Hevea brasiliensis TaxID=3981 RepID=A0A6A6LV87_HEVBR|nr:hypothetical protein GH714_004358 [Hevea brasiliensis]
MVNWDAVCSTKSDGGLGFHRLKLVNKYSLVLIAATLPPQQEVSRDVLVWSPSKDGRTLTDAQRKSRGLTVDASCFACGYVVEDVLHFLRDRFSARFGLELPCDPTQFIALKVEEVLHAYLCLDKHHIPIVQKHLMVNWSIPPHKWVKLNSEGSVVNHLGATGDLLVILVSVLFLKLNFGAFFKVSTWHGI